MRGQLEEAMQPITLPESQRNNFAKQLELEMLREQEEAGVGPEEAFLRTALRALGFNPDDGHYTDGPYDCGMDFVHVSEEETSIFQSKSQAYAHGLPTEVTLDAGYLGDIRRILEVLGSLDPLPREGNRAVIEALTSMRNEINRKALVPVRAEEEDAPEYRISIYFLGLARGFTPQAQTEFARLETQPSVRYGRVQLVISVYPVFIDDLLSEKWKQRNVDWRDKGGRKRDDIVLSVPSEAIVDAKSAVFFVHAHDLVQAYEDFGYQIFEPNVRCELKESKVNQAIKKTVTTREGRREFRHLNNGITVVCSGWTAKKTNGRLSAFVVRRPGIVNGLQTVKNLFAGGTRFGLMVGLQL
jgi:hypothetical protein